MYRKMCEECQSPFECKYDHGRFCSKGCKQSYHSRKTGRVRTSVCTGTVGAILELAVAQHFLGLGFDAYRAISPSSKSDLVVSNGKIHATVQVKSGWIGDDGRISRSPGEIESDILAIVIRNRDNSILFRPELTWFLREREAFYGQDVKEQG